MIGANKLRPCKIYNSNSIFNSSIIGGCCNTIQYSSHSSIVAGACNSIIGVSDSNYECSPNYNTILGGCCNTIYKSDYSSIIGGGSNQICGYVRISDIKIPYKTIRFKINKENILLRYDHL